MSPEENDAETDSTMSDVRQHAEEIREQFSEQLDLTVEEVEDRLDNLVNEYRVPL